HRQLADNMHPMVDSCFQMIESVNQQVRVDSVSLVLGMMECLNESMDKDFHEEEEHNSIRLVRYNVDRYNVGRYNVDRYNVDRYNVGRYNRTFFLESMGHHKHMDMCHLDS